MKLAILLSDISKIGGVQRVTTALVNELCQNIDVTIISIFSENELPAFELSDRVQVSYLLKEHVNLKKNFLKVSGALRKVLKKQQFDVVLSSGTGLVSFLWFASLGIPIRLLAWEHQCFYFGRSFGLEWLGRKLACRFAESIVVLTKKDEGFYKENRPKAHIEQIYNILDMDSQTAKCQLSSKKIISVGSLGRQKGFDLALEVASQIQLSYPDWQWDIYGDGSDREKLEEKVREYQLEGFINFKGLVQNVRECYPDYSIYAMTSRHEGLPTVLLEAKNYQMPVVSFDCNCGPSDIISDGRNGFLIDCFDINIYAKTLSKLMASLELREQVAKSSVIPAEELSTTYILDKWKNLLKIERR
ncbi:glycosyltransferase family 4 protein [Streptococcus pneumoniae]|uniref:glycosyltransferase family 4 protein n=1 Tax=Streptococcus pneumoniae TaxID=1313 RepID=UPI0010F185F4|nr:glycosyltransferase family 4 protein [Streptococcus pneumoniae]MDD0797915.1 glycosyltransferase family 4 protein [Streptococcus pneumoniae]MDS2534470.1 glycosyltransferase family 4 protein [Streptococcus pneumoniae]MDS2845952.1 glycosyltransferase family 4 protein [Streptococcus pneumoniae]MDS3468682.1 glycosyltransferase family 4 protein [Streptococcus pneumoniae]MDS3661931.1 glycosyltransferase family 4 protein [Streptococcus pneumoniae]